MTSSVLALPAVVRARIELLRAKARDGMSVTCGGVSMEPAIRRGDAVRIEAGELRRGVVAAFVTRSGVLELHRLVARAPGLAWWVHAGDNQAAPALGLVHRDQIIGVATTPVRAPSMRTRARAMTRLARAALRRTFAR